jgi:hypothetical protein
MAKNVMKSLIGLLAVFALPCMTRAQTLNVTTTRVTSSPSYDTTPTLGSDSGGSFVVYTSRDYLDTNRFDQGDIWYQRFDVAGLPDGAAVQVTNDLTDDQLNDVSGNYIVYTVYENTFSTSGEIVVYDIVTGDRYSVGNALIIREPKIHGETVVWVEGTHDATLIKRYEIGWIGTTQVGVTIGGPLPPASEVEIGDRFVVWAERDASNNYDIAAYDLETAAVIPVAALAAMDERSPVTSGGWVVWREFDRASGSSAIRALNIDEHSPDHGNSYALTLHGDGADDRNPSIDGGLIGYETNRSGDYDVHVFSLFSVRSYLVASGGGDQYLSDTFGDFMAYVDIDPARGDEDIYLARLDFVPPDPCAARGGDTDADGICDAEDNCPSVANSDQADSNGNGMGDACDDGTGVPSTRLPQAQPSGLAYDGNVLYSADAAGFRTIYMLNPVTGIVQGSFAPPGPNPRDLAYDGGGHLFVSDVGDPVTGLGVVYEIDTGGLTLNSFDVPFRAGGLAFDGTNLYIADFDSTEILVTDRSGVEARRFTSPVRPAGLTYDAAKGHLVAISQLDRQISKITTDGRLLCSFEGPREPGVQGLGGVVLAGSALHVAEVTDPDPFNPPEVPGTLFAIAQPNCAPVADAGPDPAAVRPGEVTILDGSGSYDPDGDGLGAFIWSVVSAPAGSAAVPSDPAAILPSMTPDYLGEYVLELVVTDVLGLASAPDTVIVSTYNTRPVADAGLDQAVVELNTVVGLDGSQSFDDDGDSMTFSWSLDALPTGSGAFLLNPGSPYPTFLADTHGDYIARLVVTDSWGSVSDPDLVTVSFGNVQPVADAGETQVVIAGDAVFLDGSGSFDQNLDPLTYAWVLTSLPAGSAAAPSDPASRTPTFLADLAGTYVVQLIVSDGHLASDPDSTTVTVISSADAATAALIEAIARLNAAAPGDFKNRNHQRTLGTKIGVVIGDIQDGEIAEALEKLVSDVLKKVNGCAEEGEPDKNDWITACTAQLPVYEEVMEAIALLGG